MARRALDESLARASERQLFGAPLFELQMVQGHLADMALAVDAAALLVYRAAWTKDSGAERVSREAAMAKLYATEEAQKVIDAAVQIHGGDGVRKGISWSVYIARSGRSGSTKEPPMFKKWLSRGNPSASSAVASPDPKPQSHASPRRRARASGRRL